MKTVGQLLLQAREKKNLSLDELAEETKIRPDYIQAVENDNFAQLPQATFVKGFITNLATTLDIDPSMALAVFRRDFDQNQQGKVIPRGLTKPLKTPSKFYNPRTTTIILGFTMMFLAGIYLTVQIFNFTQAPSIDLNSPEAETTTGSIVLVQGKTSSDATITVNQKPVSLNLNGEFETTLNLLPGEHTITIEAQSRDGKTRTLQRSIYVEVE